jgi:hypothetical protein
MRQVHEELLSQFIAACEQPPQSVSRDIDALMSRFFQGYYLPALLFSADLGC